MTEPREFWVCPVHRICVESPELLPQSVKYWEEKPTHVIEYSAYSQLRSQLDIAKAALEAIEASNSFYSTKQCDVAGEALKQIEEMGK